MTSEDNSIKLMATHMLRLAIIAEFTFIWTVIWLAIDLEPAIVPVYIFISTR